MCGSKYWLNEENRSYSAGRAEACVGASISLEIVDFLQHSDELTEFRAVDALGLALTRLRSMSTSGTSAMAACVVCCSLTRSLKRPLLWHVGPPDQEGDLIMNRHSKIISPIIICEIHYRRAKLAFGVWPLWCTRVFTHIHRSRFYCVINT